MPDEAFDWLVDGEADGFLDAAEPLVWFVVARLLL